MKKITIPFASRSFFVYEHFKNNNKTKNTNNSNILLILPDEESALIAYKQLCFFNNANKDVEQNTDRDAEQILFFPSLDTVPYDRVSPAAEISSQRSAILTKLAIDKLAKNNLAKNNLAKSASFKNALYQIPKDASSKIVVTAAKNLLNKLPPEFAFLNSAISISPGSNINISDLSNFLVANGYSRSASAVDSAEFAVRGEILDLVTHSGHGYRVNFSWDNIESIKKFDVYSQISKKKLSKLDLLSASEILLNSETINNFKNNFLQIFGVNHTKSPLYESIIQGRKFHGYEHLLPLFYQEKEMSELDNFMGDHEVIYDNLSVKSILEYEHTYNDFYESRLLSNKSNPDSFYFAIPVDKLIVNAENIKKRLNEKEGNILLEFGSNLESDPNSDPNNEFKQLENISTQAKIEQKSEFDKLFEVIIANKKKIPVIFCNAKSSIERIKNITANYEYISNEISNLSEAKSNFINLAIMPLASSFMTNKYLFITQQDILGNKFSAPVNNAKSTKKKLKNILTELDNISENELIVHKEHGIGRFSKIETIYVDKIAHDCLKLIYANDDIFYLPVENIDQIKKYGGDDALLDKLGSLGWQKRKSKLKNRIKDIAASLIKITAQRSLETIAPVKFDASMYEQFCNKFPYSETLDQIASINDVRQDLESGHLMDRLVCGDVGFGKTEVAMRAAFMAACDINDNLPQIAVISPTTILCKQHYTSFLERFKGMGIKIAQLSRLVKTSEINKIKHAIAEGEINIIIGTHALLAPNIKFKNLKMVIIDEEQHFGVVQKERLKNIKTGTHVLSLSATPIPRTLQMSMVGIKELSLIATPPIDRLPVRTNVIPFDGIVIRDALMRESFRGGLSFYVVPRIKDIEWVEKQLKKYVPELKYKVAHGQMQPAKIDQIMNEFYEAKFDILLSTTIIESGIDIPIANTMIIHRSDMLGLSQLYQLRGRVGRSKVRGYAYLTLESFKKTTKHSMQRLDILQNIDSLGAGFTIAGHDMDLRGFGNLVGSEQSGHIKEVGSELYQEMLDEAIKELKNSRNSKGNKNSKSGQGSNIISQNNQDAEINFNDFTPSINLGIAVLIPSSYIEDSSLRLAIYRRTGSLKTDTEIEIFRDEMIDRFGSLPKEFDNLLNMVKIKNICFDLKIQNLDSGPNGFVMRFNENFDVSAMVMNFINKYPRYAKIKPNNKLVYLKELKVSNILVETKKLLAILQTRV